MPLKSIAFKPRSAQRTWLVLFWYRASHRVVPPAAMRQQLLLPTRVSEGRNYFVAPEYLFTAKDSHFMTESEQEQLRAQLVFLSLRFPDLLLIPGSIGWFKTKVRSNERLFRKGARPLQDSSSSSSEGAKSGIKMSQTPSRKTTVRDMAKYAERYKSAAKGPIPDYSFAGSSSLKAIYDRGASDLAGMQLGELDRVGDKFESSAPEARAAKNSCFVFKAARVHHRYDKVFEAWDSTDTDLSREEAKGSVLFVPGQRPPTFECDGVKYGLELCADHNSAGLRLYTTKIASGDVDVQVVMSASTVLEDKHIVAKHFVVQADSSGSVVRTRESANPVEPEVEGPSLSLYELEW